MAYSVGGYVAGDHEPLYQEGMAHLQAGEWQEAIRCFETLAEHYPNSRLVERGLEEARFRARRDGVVRVKPRRWFLPWRQMVLRAVALLLLLFVTQQAVLYVGRQAVPVLLQLRAEQHQAELLAEANEQLELGRFDAAGARFKELLQERPDHPEAMDGLARVEAARALHELYLLAVEQQEEGNAHAALATLTDLSIRAPGYRDVERRIRMLVAHVELEELYTLAERHFQAGDLAQAVTLYEQIRAIDVNYGGVALTNRLLEGYLQLGRAITEQQPPAPDALPQALDYFNRALTLSPRHGVAREEHHLLATYLDGIATYQAGRWHESAHHLRSVYGRRPTYLSGWMVGQLYEVLIRSGDLFHQEGDLYRAYDEYLQASRLGVDDPSLAVGRMAMIQPFLTPTPTPTLTPTPRPTLVPIFAPPPVYQPPAYQPPAGAAVGTPAPTATPAQPPLSSYRNQILFFSENPEQPGLWVMAPDGSQRRYLGNSPALLDEYGALLERYQFSPDGRYRLLVREVDAIAQLFLLPPDGAEIRQLTFFERISYDPAWSPDGSRLLFVSQQGGGDDIWMMAADGSQARNLTPNQVWDKRPSWSPDSTRIAFWSDRPGHRQIFVMQADGRAPVNISQSEWNEYDPLWVR